MTEPKTKSPGKRTKGRTRAKAPTSMSRRPGSKPPRSLRMRTILVPVDFSEPSRAALAYAVRLAKDFGGTLAVLHVIDPLLNAGRLDSARLRQLKSAARKEAEEELDAVRSEMEGWGVRSKLFLRNGTASDIIVGFAAKEKADLIIIGSQGRTGLNRLLVGSVAESVVRRASCPVLVVR